jgi:hypothetical protein
VVNWCRYLDDQPRFPEAGVNHCQFSFAPPKPGPGFRNKAPMLLEGPKRKKKACMQLSIVSRSLLLTRSKFAMHNLWLSWVLTLSLDI